MAEITREEQNIRDDIVKLNMLKDYSYTPKNVVLVTVDDIVELIYELKPYTMSRLDNIQSEIAKAKEELLDELEKHINDPKTTPYFDLDAWHEVVNFIEAKRKELRGNK